VDRDMAKNCHVFQKAKAIYNRFTKSIKLNNNGFTLIEAIITIVIVGMIVTPISMVFLGSLQDAIDAKEQLKANQMAQLFVENLRIRSYEDIEDLFLVNPVITLDSTSNSQDTYNAGFPAIPEGLKVQLSIDRTIYEADADYQVSKPALEDEISDEDGDLIIYIDYNLVGLPIISFYTPDSLENDFKTINIANGENNEYDITFEGTTIKLDEKAPTPQSLDLGILTLTDTNPDNIIIHANVLKEKVKNAFHQDATFTFNITQLNNTTFSAFILRDSEDYVMPIITTQDGLVIANYNIMERNSAEYYISKIEIQVIDEVTNEVLSTMSATKIYD